MSSFSQMPQLRRLNLDDNRLSHLTQFQLASALEVFSVRGLLIISTTQLNK